MKAYKYIFGLFLTIGLVACDTEAPFENGNAQGEGSLHTANLNLSVDIDETIKVRSRSGNDDLLPDFHVYFLNSNGQSVKDYIYKDMPEVVTLPSGKYKVKAVYGQDLAADWNNPYFVGVSEKEFEIKANQITTEIDPVKCRLNNVMVSVVFDQDLLDHITGNPQVEVYVNKESSLVYKKSHSDNKTPGYFGHYEVCTLTAEFKGTVDGVNLNEIKTLTDVEPGYHYRLTFYRHVYTGDTSGKIEGAVFVDATVAINNVSENVTIGEESILTDVTWPTEDSENNNGQEGEDPKDPDDKPSTYPDGPQITLDKLSTVELGDDVTNEITADTKVILDIHSNAGIETFTVRVESNTLDLEALGAKDGVLDMIEPGDMLETLHQLELLPEGVDSLKGYNDVKFDISGFMELLILLGEDNHKFIITVGDADGEDTVYLNLSYHK